MSTEELPFSFEKRINARVYEEIVDEAKMNVREYPLKYENFSHYVRVALVRLNNFHKEQKADDKKR